MANLGTKHGAIIPDTSGAHIAGDLPRSAAASYIYMDNSTYSGTDIEVIIHVPDFVREKENLRKTQTHLESTLEAAQEDHTQAEEQLATFTKVQNPYLSEQEYNNKHNNLVQQVNDKQTGINSLESQIGDIQSSLSSYDSVSPILKLGNVQTLSISSYREKVPVRTLGSVYPRSVTRGSRTIGGSMVFTIFRQHVLAELLNLGVGYYSTGAMDFDRHTYTTVVLDQLRPLDISIMFANEYGAISHMGLYGVEFVQEGSTFSVEDIYSEAVVQYIARDFDPMRELDHRKIDKTGTTTEWSATASQLTQEALKDVAYNYRSRRNPFI